MFTLNTIFAKIKNVISYEIIPHIHSPSKKAISKAVDNIVINKLSLYEITVHRNFNRWYRQSIINIAVIVILIITGITTYAFTDRTGLLKLTVAVTYLFSYEIFIYRRIQNTKSIIKNSSVIVFYTKICIHGLLNYSYGSKLKSIAYDIYLALYNENVSNKLKKVHRLTSKLHITPSNDEVFEIVYLRLIVFIKDIVLRNLIKFCAFVLGFTILGFFVKNLVLLEMHFNNIFETFIYPFYYIINLFKKIG